jgi:hypothetical protein
LQKSANSKEVVWASATFVSENSDGSIDAGVHDELSGMEAVAAAKNAKLDEAPPTPSPKTNAPTGFPTLFAPDPTTEAPTHYPTFFLEAEAAAAAIAAGGDKSGAAAAVAEAVASVEAQGDDYVEVGAEEESVPAGKAATAGKAAAAGKAATKSSSSASTKAAKASKKKKGDAATVESKTPWGLFAIAAGVVAVLAIGFFMYKKNTASSLTADGAGASGWQLTAGKDSGSVL